MAAAVLQNISIFVDYCAVAEIKFPVAAET
jgi:hypothetical protein